MHVLETATWHIFLDVFVVCEFLISLFTMISVEQYKSSIGCSCPRIVGRKCVNDENLCEIYRDNVNCEKCMFNDLKVMCNLLVTALIIAVHVVDCEWKCLIESRTNEKCPKCELDLTIVNVVICYAMLPRGFCTLVHSFILLLSQVIFKHHAFLQAVMIACNFFWLL